MRSPCPCSKYQQHVFAGCLRKRRNPRVLARPVVIRHIPAAFIPPPPLGEIAAQQQDQAFIPGRHAGLDGSKRTANDDRFLETPCLGQRLAKSGMDVGEPIRWRINGRIRQCGLKARDCLVHAVERHQ